MRLIIPGLMLLLPLLAQGGAQKYEPLSASVQAALSRSVSDRAPPSSSFQDSMQAIDWLSEMSSRLEKRIPDRETRLDFLRAVHYEATRAGLDPQLVLSLIQVESRFNKYFYFPDYTGEQLMTIFRSMCSKNGYTLTPDAEKKAVDGFDALYKNRDVNFGNGRDVRNRFEDMVTAQSNRVAALDKPSKDDLMAILPDDIDI